MSTTELDTRPHPASVWVPESSRPKDVEIQVLTRSAAAVRGVHGSEMEQQMLAYAEQYRALPEHERPTPAPGWLKASPAGHRKYTALKKDPALVWAAYRCHADPEGIQGPVEFASIDLETSGPPGPRAFDPASGSIIEVGVVVLDRLGRETQRYETLIKPSARVGLAHGTGAIDVHGITMADVAGAPEWMAVAPQIQWMLRNRVLVAQNAKFELSWLEHHLGADMFDKARPTSDTLVLARNYFDWENHKLDRICAGLGVAYTNGHRALHDADVTAQAFVALLRQMESDYVDGNYRLLQP